MLTYFLLCYAITWASWFAASRIPDPLPRALLLYLGTFTPGLVAVGFTWRATGREGVAALLRRLFDWEVSARWYVFALGFIIAVKLTAALLLRIITGAWPTFGTESLVVMFGATFVSTFIGGQAGEEVGWRGYALPRLAPRFGLGGASLVLGAVWACWHLPLFFFPAADTFGQSFPLYFLQVVALSVAVTWLWSNTRRSLFPVMLFHAAANNTKDIVRSVVPGARNPWALSPSLMAWLTLGVLWACAVVFLLRMRSHPNPVGEAAGETHRG